MPIHLRLRLAALATMLLCATACAPPSLPFARLAGLITSGDLDEISGLASSRAHDDVLWAHNDSGNPARLYAISTRGRLLARFAHQQSLDTAPPPQMSMSGVNDRSCPASVITVESPAFAPTAQP